MLSVEDWISFVFFFLLEILGSKETPYSGGSFKLEIQLPERLGAYDTLYIIMYITIYLIPLCEAVTLYNDRPKTCTGKFFDPLIFLYRLCNSIQEYNSYDFKNRLNLQLAELINP